MSFRYVKKLRCHFMYHPVLLQNWSCVRNNSVCFENINGNIFFPDKGRNRFHNSSQHWIKKKSLKIRESVLLLPL